MTRRDLLEDNGDLLASAAQLISQQPSFTLTVTPARSGARAVMVSAKSQLPSAKAGTGIARLDVYVDGRPVRSLDARNGSVRSTRVTIGKAGSKRTAVAVHAWGHAGELLARRRTSVR